MTNNQLWPKIKELLRLQMSNATYDANIRDTQLLEATADAWLIGVPNALALDWLTHRLAHQVRQAVATLTGQPTNIQFTLHPQTLNPELGTLNSEHGTLNSEHGTLNSEHGTLNPEPLADYAKLWFTDAAGGYDRLMKYWSRYWRTYLNQFNSRAYDLWEYLLIPDIRPQDKPPYWTPTRSYQAKPLARALGCGPAAITGGFRQCSVCDRANLIGSPRQDCCGNHQPHEWRLNQHGDQQCRYWRQGAMEILYQERLLAIRITGDAPKNTFYHLQVWRLLPLLTPWQVSHLPANDQDSHQDWISHQSDTKNHFDRAAWQNYPDLRMVAHLPDAGRDHWGLYQPNPLLAPFGDNNADERTYRNELLDSMESDNLADDDLLSPFGANKFEDNDLLDSMESNN